MGWGNTSVQQLADLRHSLTHDLSRVNTFGEPSRSYKQERNLSLACIWIFLRTFKIIQPILSKANGLLLKNACMFFKWKNHGHGDANGLCCVMVDNKGKRQMPKPRQNKARKRQTARKNSRHTTHEEEQRYAYAPPWWRHYARTTRSWAYRLYYGYL